MVLLVAHRASTFCPSWFDIFVVVVVELSLKKIDALFMQDI